MKRKSSISNLEAVGLALAGYTCWVFADTTIKMAGSSHLPAYEVIFFLGLFIVLFLFLRSLLRGEVRKLWPKRPGRQLIRSSLDLINNLGVVIALRHLPLTLFYILVFLSPIATTTLEAIFLKERHGWKKIVAVVTGFLGVVIAVNPFGSGRQGDWIGYVACLVCVTCFSANMVWSRVITQSEEPANLIFFSGLVMAAYGLVCMLWRAEPITPRLGVVLLLMGLFAVVGNISFFIALKHTSAATVSQYHYTQLITGALVTYAIWKEKPTVAMVCGGLLILGSGAFMAYNIYRERGKAPLLDHVLTEEFSRES